MSRRFKDIEWTLPENAKGALTDWRFVDTAVLMDIRDALAVISRKLSALECPNFLAIPSTLAAIEKNGRKPKRKRRKAAR
jgi:hypothetical protein